MPTYYSNYGYSNPNYYESSPAYLDPNYYSSIYGTISITLDIPGGILTWSKNSNLISNLNACRIHRTVEAGIPMGNPISIISKIYSYIMTQISGTNVYTPYFRAPSISITSEEFRISDISNNINLFLEGEDKVDQKDISLLTHIRPLRVVIGRKENDMLGVYAYFDDGKVYAFEINDEFSYSSSSSSTSSSVTISTSSSKSSSSTHKEFSSWSSASSKSTMSSGSSSTEILPSSLSLSSLSGSSLSSFSTSSISSLSLSSLSSTSSRSSASSSSMSTSSTSTT